MPAPDALEAPRQPALAWAAALDAIARHRATGDPLERCLHDVAQLRRLGPRERRAAGDAAFAWARRREVGDRIIDDALAREGGVKPSRRDRDLCVLILATLARGHVDGVDGIDGIDGIDGDGDGDVDMRAARLPAVLARVVDDVRARGLLGLGLGLAPELPAWLAEALTRSGEQVAELVDALARPAPLVLAVDVRRASVDDVLAAIRKQPQAQASRSPVVHDAVRVAGRFSVATLPPPLRDAVWPMDDGSQAIALAVAGATPDGFDGVVLDMCAGGGGKSRLLSTLMSRARIVASDVHLGRLSPSASRAPSRAPSRSPSRSPSHAARLVVADGGAPPFAPSTFDRVLVDAPCSGTGTLRRAPDLAHRLKPEDVARFVARQKALLTQALALTKPSGLVVYATCSLLREENEDVVDAVLSTPSTSKWRRVPFTWRGVRVDDDSARRGEVRLRPHLHGTDGFYVCALGRAP